MKKNKLTIILSVVLLILIIIIVSLMISIKNKYNFKKPDFDKNATNTIPINLDYQSKIINVTDNYSLYVEPSPTIEDNDLTINLISLETNNILIKVRVLNNDKIVAETGLIKPGQYLKNVKLKKKLNMDDEIIYVIMGYEPDTYLSAGSIKLNTRIGE